MKIFLKSFLSVLFVAGEISAQNPESVPKLVVGITIDQLRYDYIEMFKPLFGEKGFARLFREGIVCRNGEYGFSNPDKASATAAIYTGATPYVNGIVGRKWFDRDSDKLAGCIDDDKYAGIYTMRGASPEKLMTTTLADELKIATGGKSIIYSIAADAEMAVLAGGRNANGSFWINDNNGKWSSSTYYGEFSGWAARYNDENGLDLKLDTMAWKTLKNVSLYKYLTSEWEDGAFDWNFKNFKKLKYSKFKTSGLVNEEINNLAEICLNNSGMGTDNIPDLLMLAYNAGNFDDRSTIQCIYEIQDTYVRLDKELARIMSLVEKKVGSGNVLFFVTSTGYVNSEMKDLSKYNIPSGEFYLNRCSALLNMFFMAKYGDGNYIEGFYGDEIYINRKTLEEKKLDYEKILNEASEFLITFDGIADVFTSKRLLLDINIPELYFKRNAFNRERSGDIMIEILPGWSSRDENSYVNNVKRLEFVETPLFFWGNGLKADKQEAGFRVEQIIPTVSKILRIRSPNAAAGHPLLLKK